MIVHPSLAVVARPCTFEDGDRVVKLFKLPHKYLPYSTTHKYVFIGIVCSIPLDEHKRVYWQYKVTPDRLVLPFKRSEFLKVNILLHLLAPGVSDKPGCNCRSRLTWLFARCQYASIYRDWFIPPSAVGEEMAVVDDGIPTLSTEVGPGTRKGQIIDAINHCALLANVLQEEKPDLVDECLLDSKFYGPSMTGWSSNVKPRLFGWPASEPFIHGQQREMFSYADDNLDSDEDFIDNPPDQFTVSIPSLNDPEALGRPVQPMSALSLLERELRMMSRKHLASMPRGCVVNPQQVSELAQVVAAVVTRLGHQAFLRSKWGTRTLRRRRPVVVNAIRKSKLPSQVVIPTMKMFKRLFRSSSDIAKTLEECVASSQPPTSDDE